MGKISAFMVMIIFSGFILLSGCSQKRVAVADKPEQPKPTETATITTTPPPSTSSEQQAKITMPAKETVTERIASAKAQPSEADAIYEEIKSALKDIYFDFDRYDISEASRPVIKQVAAALTKTNAVKVIIEGHCDERGTNEYNLSLGEKRAFAVKEYLLTLGIVSNRIQTVSYGEEKPACKESTEECWAQNRRAHFVLVREK
ncbi:MAG: peptidoglycan-associated lipoprotein Pal [Dissulfurispiraceae bacterium]|jgi:peptidoglycan-associated lipoprotein|nr:peptidoglycan-associated lipoprotein Pal [Dissulfurispiraceae bacterium]